MNKSDVQFIKKDGNPQYVVMPIEKYREFLALLDDIADYSAIDKVLIDYRDGDTVPGKFVNAILKGAPPLRVWREYRGFTLDSLASRIGVSKSYLSQIENGRMSGSLRLYCQISIVLNATVDDLVDWSVDNAS